MKPTRYNPFAASKTFGNFADSFFNNSIADFFGSDFTLSSPSVNVIEDGNFYRIEVAAPGLEKGDFEVNIENGFLNISAEHKQEEEVKEGKYMRREFNYTSFKRSFELPDTVKADKVEAKYENGILKINLPKKAETKVENSRLIEIK
jgi:HSP20 family protein